MDKLLHILAFTHDQSRVLQVQQALAISPAVAVLHTAASCDGVSATLASTACDCLLLDATLPKHEAKAALDACTSARPTLAVLMLASVSDEAAYQMVGATAVPWLLLEQLTPAQLLVCIRNAARTTQDSTTQPSSVDETTAHERLALLASVGQLLDATDNCSQCLPQVAQQVVARFADWCAIDVTAGYSEPTRVAQAWRGTAIAVDVDGSSLERLDGTARIRVPLTARGQQHGTMTFTRHETNNPFTSADHDLAAEIGRRVANTLALAMLEHTTEEALHARDTFLSVIAHELKTPLTALLGYATLLQRRVSHGGLHPERDLRGATVMVEQARRLSKLVNNLLDLSRMSHGQLQIAQQVCNMAELIRHVAHQIEPALQHHTLYIDAADDIYVTGDADRLELVVWSLTQNAIKYSSAGGAIVVQLTAAAGQAHLSVQDHGTGIVHERLPYIFGRFNHPSGTPLHTATALGVGLYMVKHIVELHGGSIDVQSTEDVGSTFTVHLPLAAEHTYEHAQQSVRAAKRRVG